MDLSGVIHRGIQAGAPHLGRGNPGARMGRRVADTRPRGFSLIEIAMVLAIAAVIIAGVMLFFGQATDNRKSEELLQEIGALQQAVRSLYAASPAIPQLPRCRSPGPGSCPRNG